MSETHRSEEGKCILAHNFSCLSRSSSGPVVSVLQRERERAHSQRDMNGMGT